MKKAMQKMMVLLALGLGVGFSQAASATSSATAADAAEVGYTVGDGPDITPDTPTGCPGSIVEMTVSVSGNGTQKQKVAVSGPGTIYPTVLELAPGETGTVMVILPNQTGKSTYKVASGKLFDTTDIEIPDDPTCPTELAGYTPGCSKKTCKAGCATQGLLCLRKCRATYAATDPRQQLCISGCAIEELACHTSCLFCPNP
jgi:hypothetical protein